MRHGTRFLIVVVAITAVPAPSLARVLPSVTARESPPAADRSTDIPSDADLEAAHAVIGTVTFEALDLFDTSRADEDVSLFRLANRLHIRTRDATVARQLLFKEGDLYRGRLLQESERILRDTRYLLDAHIRPVAFHDGLVDVMVTTQDVWTLNPGVSYGRKGGQNTSGFELEELNLLGTGTELGVGFKSGLDRDSRQIHFRDRQLGSSWWTLATQYAANSDGRSGELTLERPFFSLDTQRAGGFEWRDDLRNDSRYDRGEIIDRFETHARYATAWFGLSGGWLGGWTRRYSVGFTDDDSRFDTLAADDDLPGTTLLPSNRHLAYPWIAADFIEDDFHTTRNRDRIGRTEDFTLGWRLHAQLGYSSSTLGADRDAVVYAATLAKGVQWGERHTLQFDAYASGRYESSALAGALVGAAARYYLRQSDRALFYATVSADQGTHLDLDQQLLLGGDSGLRGYPLRYQAGTSRWLFTAEQRWFSNWYPFRLINVGAAAFFDIGASLGQDPLATAPLGTLKDIGLGLRLAGNRSAEGNVVHIDLAYPLDGDRSIRKLQLVVETRHRF